MTGGSTTEQCKTYCENLQGEVDCCQLLHISASESQCIAFPNTNTLNSVPGIEGVSWSGLCTTAVSVRGAR